MMSSPCYISSDLHTLDGFRLTINKHAWPATQLVSHSAKSRHIGLEGKIDYTIAILKITYLSKSVKPFSLRAITEMMVRQFDGSRPEAKRGMLSVGIRAS